MPRVANQYRGIIQAGSLSEYQLRQVIDQILDHLHLEIVKEEIPDYTLVSIQHKGYKGL